MSNANSAWSISLEEELFVGGSGWSLAKRLGNPWVVFRVLRNSTRPVPCLSARSRISLSLVCVVNFLPLVNSNVALLKRDLGHGNC